MVKLYAELYGTNHKLEICRQQVVSHECRVQNIYESQFLYASLVNM